MDTFDQTKKFFGAAIKILQVTIAFAHHCRQITTIQGDVWNDNVIEFAEE